MKWEKRVVATAACFVLASAAFAADAPTKPTGMRGDVDGSGTLTAKELVEERANFFAAIDGDKDGKIHIEKFILALKKDFETRDIDRNGLIAADEFVVSWCGKPAASQAAKAKAAKPALVKGNMLKQMDKSGNGQIEPEECVQFWATRFGELDANSDGKVSQDEFIAAMRQAAERIDTNKDSFISIDEYKWYWADVPQAAKKAAPAAVK